MSLVRGKRKWKLEPFPGDPWGMWFDKPPCWLNRLMQKWLLGFTWRRE
jgi:hypothetical protein